MKSPLHLSIPTFVLQSLNHLYDAERKLTMHGDPGGALGVSLAGILRHRPVECRVRLG